MAIEKLASDAAALMKRIDEEKANLSAVELVLDGSNKISFPGYPYTFEAIGEKILVSIDIFKSGYECKLCKGKRQLRYKCPCVNSDRPGMKYSIEQLAGISEALGASVEAGRREQVCPGCGGNPASVERDETCPSCRGRGAILELPESSKNQPVTGVVVSMGTLARDKAEFKVGDRVLFGTHTGTMIPTQSGIAFKHMDWYAIALKIEGAAEMGQFDFILREDE